MTFHRSYVSAKGRPHFDPKGFLRRTKRLLKPVEMLPSGLVHRQAVVMSYRTAIRCDPGYWLEQLLSDNRHLALTHGQKHRRRQRRVAVSCSAGDPGWVRFIYFVGQWVITPAEDARRVAKLAGDADLIHAFVVAGQLPRKYDITNDPPGGVRRR